jgi:hypothetical protein
MCFEVELQELWLRSKIVVIGHILSGMIVKFDKSA